MEAWNLLLQKLMLIRHLISLKIEYKGELGLKCVVQDYKFQESSSHQSLSGISVY